MKTEEANEVIAGFMGMYYINTRSDGEKCDPFISDQQTGHAWATCVRPFTESLDALVPVWEKLGLKNRGEIGFYADNNGYSFGIWDTPKDAFCGFYEWGDPIDARAPTIQEAAAIATAKAILDTKKA